MRISQFALSFLLARRVQASTCAFFSLKLFLLFLLLLRGFVPYSIWLGLHVVSSFAFVRILFVLWYDSARLHIVFLPVPKVIFCLQYDSAFVFLPFQGFLLLLQYDFKTGLSPPRDAKWCRTGLLSQATHQCDVTFNWSVIQLFPPGWKTGQFGAANE